MLRRTNDESGIALLIAIVLLMMVSMIGVAALQSSQGENATSGRSRRKVANLQAAEAGLRIVHNQLLTSFNAHDDDPNRTPIDVQLLDNNGNITTIKTRNSFSDAPGDETAIPIVDQTLNTTKPCADENGGQSGLTSKQYGSAAGGFNCKILRARIIAADISDVSGAGVEAQFQYRIP